LIPIVVPDRKRDQKRLLELRSKEKDGTLSYLERIELELLVEEQAKSPRSVVEVGAWEELEPSEEGKSERKTVEAGPQRRPPENKDLKEEFEVVGADEDGEEEEEDSPARRAVPPKRPAPQETVDNDQAKAAVAFGAGAIMGYFLKGFLEDDMKFFDVEDEDEENSDKEEETKKQMDD
jgi:hypothetical protein